MRRLINLTEENIKNNIEKNPEMKVFIVCGCRVMMNPKDEIIMQSHKSRRTWNVLLQKEPGSEVYIDLLFDECPDYKDIKKGTYNCSRGKNPYFGLLYSPTKNVDDKRAFEAWKSAPGQDKYRYSRTVDCIRFAVGMFPNTGLTMDDMVNGRAKYDDLYKWMVGYIKGTPYPEHYVIPPAKEDVWASFGSTNYKPEKDNSLPWDIDLSDDGDALPF